MKLSLVGGVTAVVLLIAAIVGYSTFFTVYQTKQALVVRLGNPVRVITEPGLNVKVPFIDSVIYIDKRILTIEQPAQEVIASSGDSANAGAGQAGERLVVDAFARYRITDPLKYYQTVGPDGASSQLAILLNSTLRSVLGAATLTDVVRNKREELDGARCAISSITMRSRSAFTSSTCAFAAPICRNRTARRSITACRPNVSVKRPSSAPKAARRLRRSAPRPTAT